MNNIKTTNWFIEIEKISEFLNDVYKTKDWKKIIAPGWAVLKIEIEPNKYKYFIHTDYIIWYINEN